MPAQPVSANCRHLRVIGGCPGLRQQFQIPQAKLAEPRGSGAPRPAGRRLARVGGGRVVEVIARIRREPIRGHPLQATLGEVFRHIGKAKSQPTPILSIWSARLYDRVFDMHPEFAVVLLKFLGVHSAKRCQFRLIQLVTTAATVLGAFRYARRSRAADAHLVRRMRMAIMPSATYARLKVQGRSKSPTREIARRPLTRPRIRRAAAKLLPDCRME
jgi:hypothetical protein